MDTIDAYQADLANLTDAAQADAADMTRAANTIEALLDQLVDEKRALEAKPWVVENGALTDIAGTETQEKLLSNCRRYCVFGELCPLKTAEDEKEANE